jgi:hypothetical protein
MSVIQIRMAVLAARIEASHIGRAFTYIGQKPVRPTLTLKGGVL